MVNFAGTSPGGGGFGFGGLGSFGGFNANAMAGLGLGLGDHAMGPGSGFGGTSPGAQAGPAGRAAAGLAMGGSGPSASFGPGFGFNGPSYGGPGGFAADFGGVGGGAGGGGGGGWGGMGEGIGPHNASFTGLNWTDSRGQQRALLDPFNIVDMINRSPQESTHFKSQPQTISGDPAPQSGFINASPPLSALDGMVMMGLEGKPLMDPIDDRLLGFTEATQTGPNASMMGQNNLGTQAWGGLSPTFGPGSTHAKGHQGTQPMNDSRVVDPSSINRGAKADPISPSRMFPGREVARLSPVGPSARLSPVGPSGRISAVSGPPPGEMDWGGREAAISRAITEAGRAAQTGPMTPVTGSTSNAMDRLIAVMQGENQRHRFQDSRYDGGGGGRNPQLLAQLLEASGPRGGGR